MAKTACVYVSKLIANISVCEMLSLDIVDHGRRVFVACYHCCHICCLSFFFQAEDGIRDVAVTGVQTCALPISPRRARLLRYNGAYSQGLEAIIRWKLSAPKFSKICAAAAPRANEKLPFAPAGRILLPRNARKFWPFFPATPTKSSPPARKMGFSRSP